MATHINSLDWFIISVYAMCLIGISIYHSRRIKHQDDIFLAGRKMRRWPIAISMYMAVFSTNTLLGTSGWVVRANGTVWIGLQTIGIVLAVPIVVYLYPALFFRLRLTSAYEYLEKRFNYRVRTIATVLFLFSRLMWLATILYSSSLILSLALGWTGENGHKSGQIQSMLVVGCTATFFALAGGMRAVIWTDVLQFFALLIGLVTMLIQGIHLDGGMAKVIHEGIVGGRFRVSSVIGLSDELSICSGLAVGFVGMIAASGADQVLLQQYLTAKSESEAKASIWRNGLILKPFSLIYPFLGLIMFVYYRSHPDIARWMRVPDDALPVFVLHVLPAGLRGLMVLGMMASVITSVSSGVTAISTILHVDYVAQLVRRPLSERERVRAARTLLLICGITVLCLATLVSRLGTTNNVLQIINIVMYPFAGVLLGTFLLGILTRRANSSGTTLGMIGGFFLTILAPISRDLYPVLQTLPILDILGTLSTFYYGLLATVTTIGFGYIASRFSAVPSPTQLQGLTKADEYVDPT